jgi:hypothetical protein
MIPPTLFESHGQVRVFTKGSAAWAKKSFTLSGFYFLSSIPFFCRRLSSAIFIDAAYITAKKNRRRAIASHALAGIQFK